VAVAVAVSPAKRQRDRRHRDDDSLDHHEMPYSAAIRRAFCSSISRRAWVILDLGDACFLEACFPEACFLEGCGFAVSAVAGGAAAGATAAAGASLSGGTRSMRSPACTETEARAKAAIRTNLRT
jgi:hypothetical protein